MRWRKASNVINAVRTVQHMGGRADQQQDHAHIPGATRAGMIQDSQPYHPPENTRYSRPDGRGESVSLSNQPGWSSPQHYSENRNNLGSRPVSYDQSRNYHDPGATIPRGQEYQQGGYAFQNNVQSAYPTQGVHVFQQGGPYHQQIASPSGLNYSDPNQMYYFQDQPRAASPGRYGDHPTGQELGMNHTQAYELQDED